MQEQDSTQVLTKANDILSSISQPSVCSEVLLSPEGANYISGVVEVYRVSKRIEGGMTAFNIVSESLQPVLKDIDLSWNNLQAFLSMSPCVLHRLPSQSALDYKVEGFLSDSTHCVKRCCGVCLLERPEEGQLLSDPAHSMLIYESHLYHTSCANFWMHCVDSSLPVLPCHNCRYCLKLNQVEI
ncbi:synergin gamma-like isoform X2 [Bombina bombina]|uniref:synergin gamma-like isoform X2 n=1 Tax=Bombina bombina TaxID=8345 RepID=UPI00235B0DAE|nr:synergin gamma-like isoform X2 [Bombina bombina]